MLELILRSNCFLSNTNCLVQKHVTAMGSAFGFPYAIIFLGDEEGNIFEHCELWHRFIDDAFLV